MFTLRRKLIKNHEKNVEKWVKIGLKTIKIIKNGVKIRQKLIKNAENVLQTTKKG